MTPLASKENQVSHTEHRIEQVKPEGNVQQLLFTKAISRLLVMKYIFN